MAFSHHLVGIVMMAAVAAILPVPGGAQAPAHSFAPSLVDANVRDIQRQLTERGYRPGAIDGRLTPQLRQAIMAYQRDTGQAADGTASPALQNHLRFTTPRIYARGREALATRDPVVLLAQVRLLELGYYRGQADGLDGPMTRRAAAAYARDRALDPDDAHALLQRIADEIR